MEKLNKYLNEDSPRGLFKCVETGFQAAKEADNFRKELFKRIVLLADPFCRL